MFVLVQAGNNAGWSAISKASPTITPPSSPAAVCVTRHVVTPTTIKLSWQEPACHGADILHYNIDMSDHMESTSGPALEHVLEGLIPDTTYRSLNCIITSRSVVLCHVTE